MLFIMELKTKKVRKQTQKRIEGRIDLDAVMNNNVLVIQITDDGAGIDPENIARIAIEKHIYTEEEIEKMSKTQKIKIIFDKNFSSANNVNLTSGRGLGLKIVKEKIEALGGSD